MLNLVHVEATKILPIVTIPTVTAPIVITPIVTTPIVTIPIATSPITTAKSLDYLTPVLDNGKILVLKIYF